jgi:hypothetical protein
MRGGGIWKRFGRALIMGGLAAVPESDVYVGMGDFGDAVRHSTETTDRRVYRRNSYNDDNVTVLIDAAACRARGTAALAHFYSVGNSYGVRGYRYSICTLPTVREARRELLHTYLLTRYGTNSNVQRARD